MTKFAFQLNVVSCLVISSCASSSGGGASPQELFYGDCDVIKLEKITRELALEKYPRSRYALEYPYIFKDLGDRLRFYTHFPKTYLGGSPTTEFDKKTCKLIRIYETE